MKILITTDLYSVKTNGVVSSVNNLYYGLLEKGYDIRVLTLSDCWEDECLESVLKETKWISMVEIEA